MLTLKEAGWSLCVFKIFSILNIFRMEVDVKGGKIQRQSSGVKVFIWKFLYGVGVSHWFYMFGRFLQSTVTDKEKYFRWDHFVLHFGLMFGAAVFYYTGYLLFVKNVEENVMIFNQLFREREDPVQKMMEQSTQLESPPESGKGSGKRGNKTRGKSGAGAQLASASVRRSNEKDQHKNQEVEKQSKYKYKTQSEVRQRPLLTWPPQYSLDELVGKLVPAAAAFSGFFAVLILAIDPSRPQLLYSSLPPEYKNVWSFFVLLSVETLCLTFYFNIAGFSFATQVLFFGKCQLAFRRMSLQLRNLQLKFQNGLFGDRDVRREIWTLREILKEMRELVVLIELFNRCFPFCIFAWKICALGVSIVFNFFVIRHFHEFPILGFFLGYLTFMMTLVYLIMYQKAFSIPRKMDDLKNEFLLTAQKTTKTSNSTSGLGYYGNKILWAQMKREIWRIHGVGIKVGNFNQMERESTPTFVDFVLRNVVTLLVTIPR